MKTFREQGIECKNDGTQFLEGCVCGCRQLVMCKKYGGQCMSKKCKDERMKEDLNEEGTTR